MKMYYLLTDPTFKTPINTYWHGDSSRALFLTTLRGFVIPLGTKKPKKLNPETLREF